MVGGSAVNVKVFKVNYSNEKGVTRVFKSLSKKQDYFPFNLLSTKKDEDIIGG